MSGNWKTRRRRRDTSGGSYFGGIVKGTLAGGVLLGGGAVALLLSLPPMDRTAEAPAPSDGPEDAQVREARGRAGPTSMGSFAEQETAAVAAPTRAPTVSAPSAPGAVASAVSAAPVTPAAQETASSGIAGLGAGEATGAFSREPASPIGTSGLGPAPASPSGLASPYAPQGAAAGTPRATGEMTPEEARAALAALEAEEAGTLPPALGQAPAGMAAGARPGGPAGTRSPATALIATDPAALSPEEARAALAALEAAEGAPAEGSPAEGPPAEGPPAEGPVPTVSEAARTEALLSADPATLSPDEARAALATLEDPEKRAPAVTAPAPTPAGAFPAATSPAASPPAATNAAMKATTSPVAAVPQASETAPMIAARTPTTQADDTLVASAPTVEAEPVEPPRADPSSGGGFTFTTTPQPGGEAPITPGAPAATAPASAAEAATSGPDADAAVEVALAPAAITEPQPEAEAPETGLGVPLPRRRPANFPFGAVAATEPAAADAWAPTAGLPETQRPAAEIDLDGNAFAVNAQPMALAADAQPLAIVLVATPQEAGALDAVVAGNDAPLALALPPGIEGVAGLADQARAASFEIVAAIAPGDGRAAALGAGAQDPVLAGLSALPQAIAAMPMPGARGVGRPERMFDALAEYGFGYLDPRPLGSASTVRAAEGRGIPAGAIDRQSAGTGSKADIARAIQVAAGVARRQGTAILLAPATPEAMAAIADWQGERGRGAVTLAPLSRVITLRAR